MTPPATDAHDSLNIPVREAEGLVRLIEAAPGVRRRYQFFVWMQTHVHLLLPHEVAVCGVWRRHVRDMAWESFHGVVLDDAVLGAMTATGATPMRQVMRRWLDQGGAPVVVSLDALHAEGGEGVEGGVWRGLAERGMGHVLAHGVSRPDRPSEVESLFLFLSSGVEPMPKRSYFLELLIPHLHAVYLRVQTTERELGALPARPRLATADDGGQRWQLTDRERQILYWVREGKSNQQIGEQLAISALTVKNHIQKILRKMGASNRAQAVSLAISGNLLKDLKHDGRP